MKAANQRSHHDMRKSQSSRRNTRWPQEKKETQKEAVSRSNREREKHRKADRCHDEDEDFPRGPRAHSSPGTFKSQKPHKSFHHSHQHRPREDKPPKEGRRGKHRKKASYAEDDGDNLFLIKQRTKKSKL